MPNENDLGRLAEEMDEDLGEEGVGEEEPSDRERELISGLSQEEKQLLLDDPYTSDAVKRALRADPSLRKVEEKRSQQHTAEEDTSEKYPEVTDEEWDQALADNPELEEQMRKAKEAQEQEEAEDQVEEDLEESARQAEHAQEEQPRSPGYFTYASVRQKISDGTAPTSPRRLFNGGATVRIAGRPGNNLAERKVGPGRFTYTKMRRR